MKIRCLHGFFMIEEVRAGEVSDFISVTGLSLVRKENYFTFEKLDLAPEFSLEGLDYLDAVAIKTFAGRPWDVMRENELVYDFNKDLVVPIATITQMVTLQAASNYYLAPGLILPGSLTDEGERVTDYAAWFSSDTGKFKYSEVTLD